MCHFLYALHLGCSHCCRCDNENEEVNVQLLLRHCPALMRGRQTATGSAIFYALFHISAIELKYILNFVKTSVWFYVGKSSLVSKWVKVSELNID